VLIAAMKIVFTKHKPTEMATLRRAQDLIPSNLKDMLKAFA
jgi:hypothetical protein